MMECQNETGEATQKAMTSDLVVMPASRRADFTEADAHSSLCSALQLPKLWSHGENSSRTGREETEPSGPVPDSAVSSNGQLLPRQQREEVPDVAAGGRSHAPVNLHLVARENEKDSQAGVEAEEKRQTETHRNPKKKKEGPRGQ
ncbi:proline-rich protein 15-like protein A isoform X2 [Labeo rohita]|uniref:proline-rich protein 15-like protein A isoform X2 n=1 Tax=Labeo rohita TaxID=84645 RepID=UPI0021E1EB75|nr:proline-rich protein 15-like protein A isoform X2 [Labeo rohita]